MSDSEDDAAFASADEGEEIKASLKRVDNSKNSDVAKSSDTKTDKAADSKPLEAADVVKSEGAYSGKGKKKGKQAKKNKQKQEKSVQGEIKIKTESTEPNKEQSKEQVDTGKSETETQNEKAAGTTQPEKTEPVKASEVEASKEESEKTDDKELLIKCPSGQNIARETDDGELDKKDIKSVLDQLAEDEDDVDKESSSWGWGDWGTSILKVAETSVSTFSHQFGEGLNTIIDTMENTLGAIPPEQLAYMKSEKDKETEQSEEAKTTESSGKEITEQPKSQDVDKQTEVVETKESKTENVEETKENTASGGGWFSSWGMSSIKDAVAKTSNMSKNLVSGGMDVLETVGKKAFDFIDDHDPGVRKSKEVLFDKGNKPNLSQILKEAKENADYKAEMEKESEEARKAHFGYLFDEYQGISHLEALEILSNQCEKKVQVLLSSLPTETVSSIKSQLIEIKQIFEQENEDHDDDEEQEHEFIKEMTELLTNLHLGTTPSKINKVHEKIRKEITDFYEIQEKNEKMEPKTMHQKAIQSLAELTSKAMEQFHKAGELILIQKDSDKSFVERAKCLLSINRLLSTEVSILSTKFSHCLNKLGEDLEDDSCINQMVTNVYLEASNSSTYIHDGFQLLLPCLQQAAIENTPGITE